MKFPWTRPRDASTDELTEQLEHARAAHEAAQAAIAPAQLAFDDTGDDGAAKTLSKAREAAGHAQEHLSRAQRLLDAAKAREAEEARKTAAARVAELDAQLSHAPVLAAGEPLEELEVDLLLKLAGIRAERHQLAERLSVLARERYSLRLKLGTITPNSHEGNTFQHRTTLLSADRVVAALREHMGSIARDDERFAALAKIVESMGGDPRPATMRIAPGAA